MITKHLNTDNEDLGWNYWILQALHYGITPSRNIDGIKQSFRNKLEASGGRLKVPSQLLQVASLAQDIAADSMTDENPEADEQVEISGPIRDDNDGGFSVKEEEEDQPPQAQQPPTQEPPTRPQLLPRHANRPVRSIEKPDEINVKAGPQPPAQTSESCSDADADEDTDGSSERGLDHGAEDNADGDEAEDSPLEGFVTSDDSTDGEATYQSSSEDSESDNENPNESGTLRRNLTRQARPKSSLAEPSVIDQTDEFEKSSSPAPPLLSSPTRQSLSIIPVSPPASDTSSFPSFGYLLSAKLKAQPPGQRRLPWNHSSSLPLPEKPEMANQFSNEVLFDKSQSSPIPAACSHWSFKAPELQPDLNLI
jgi:hypothetical protein